MKGMCPLSWLWGFGECSHSSFISPCSAGCGIHFGSDWSLQGNFVQAPDCQDGCIRFWFWRWKMTIVGFICVSCLMELYDGDKKCRKWEGKTKSHYYLRSYHLGGPGEHRGRYSGWSKPALLGGEVILKTFIWSHINTRLPPPPLFCSSVKTTYKPHKFPCVWRSPSGRLPGGIIQGAHTEYQWEEVQILPEGWKGKVSGSQSRYCQARGQSIVG